MAVKYRTINDIAIIKVKGNLVGDDSTQKVHEQVRAATSAGIKKVILDLNAVKWMNSHGVGIFMACYSTVRNVNGKMGLCRIPKKVMMMANRNENFCIFI